MKVRLLVNRRYPAAWVPSSYFPPIKAGTVVPVVPANNIPRPNCYWVNTPELEDDCYGILLEPGDYELLED